MEEPGSFAQDRAQVHSSIPAKQRIRLPACNNCQSAKVRCCQTRPACSSCVSRGLPSCQYKAAKQLKRPRRHSASVSSPSTTPQRRSSARTPRGVQGQGENAESAGNLAENHARLPSPQASGTYVQHNEGTGYVSDSHNSPADPSAVVSAAVAQSSMAHHINSTATPSSFRYANDAVLVPGPVSSPFPDAHAFHARDFIDKHVNAYFECFHGLSTNGFLHRATFIRSISQKKASQTVLLAVCAAASRYLNAGGEATSHRDGSQLAANWAREATSRLYNSNQICFDNAVASIILARHAIHSGRYGQAWSLIAIANRQAMALGLYNDNPNRHRVSPRHLISNDVAWVEAEMRRRVMWACYCCDRMMATGIREYTLCPSDSIKLCLPVESSNFDLDIPADTPRAEVDHGFSPTGSGLLFQGSSLDAVGLMGHHVRLITLRYAILNHIRDMTSGWAQTGFVVPWSADSGVSKCHARLDAFKQSLPNRFELSVGALYARHASGELHSLIMLHIWWHKLFCELYQFSLPGHVETIDASILALAPSGWIDGIRRQCLYHARAVAGIVSIVENTFSDQARDLMTILDPSLAFILVDIVRLQLQCLSTTSPIDEGIRWDTAHDPTVFREECTVLANHVQRLTKWYSNAKRFLERMHHILSQHGIDVSIHIREERPRGATDSSSNDHGHAETVETPNHPWTDKVQRQSQIDHQHSMDLFEPFLQSLPGNWTMDGPGEVTIRGQRMDGIGPTDGGLHLLALASERTVPIDLDGMGWDFMEFA